MQISSVCLFGCKFIANFDNKVSWQLFFPAIGFSTLSFVVWQTIAFFVWQTIFASFFNRFFMENTRENPRVCGSSMTKLEIDMCLNSWECKTVPQTAEYHSWIWFLQLHDLTAEKNQRNRFLFPLSYGNYSLVVTRNDCNNNKAFSF